MARLYADENFSYPVVEELRRLGHEVLTAQEAGQANKGIEDPAVLAYALGQGRALLTFNRKHFIRLHRLAGGHAGIIACTRDDDTTALAGRIHQALEAAPSLAGILLRIYRPAK
jgi:hypothetical protein